MNYNTELKQPPKYTNHAKLRLSQNNSKISRIKEIYLQRLKLVRIRLGDNI